MRQTLTGLLFILFLIVGVPILFIAVGICRAIEDWRNWRRRRP